MSATNLDTILSGLDKVRKSGAGWTACCPAHNDHEPSLSISEYRTGKVLVKCWAGCSQHEVIAALRNMGLWGSESRGAYPRPAPRPRDAALDADDSRRMRQAQNVWEAAGNVADFPDLITYIQARGLDPSAVIAAGARAARIPRARIDKAPSGWVVGEIADAILYPVYHPDDIFKTGDKRLIGVQREWPWGRPGGPRSVKAARGKTHAPGKAGAGGFLIGTLAHGGLLNICEGQLTGHGIHAATGGATLVLYSVGGLAGIGAGTIRALAEVEARVRIAGDADPSRAGEEKGAEPCAERIRLIAPQVPVTISLPEGEKTDWLDVLVEQGPEVAARILTERERPPRPPRLPAHSDFLTNPNLSGGPLGPEPPPRASIIDNVVPQIPWEKLPPKIRPPLPTYAQMQADLDRIVPLALEMAMAGVPVLIKAPPGSGKTHRVQHALKTAQVAQGHVPDYKPLKVRRVTRGVDSPAIKETAARISVPANATATPSITHLAGGRKITVGSVGMGAFSSIGFGAHGTRVLSLPTLGMFQARVATFLMLHPTKDLSALGAVVTGGWNWDGRPTPGLCDKVTVTDLLAKRGRSPQQNACLTCEFGIKPQGPDADDNRCQFQKNLSAVYLWTGIHAQHGAGGRESTLYKHADDPRDDLDDRDALVIDEGVPTDITHTIGIDDVMAARNATASIDDHISELRNKAEKKKRRKSNGHDKAEAEERYTEEDYQAARAWAAAIGPELEVLGSLILSSPKKPGTYLLHAEALADFIRLAKKIPKAAMALDATALEKVLNVWGEDRVVPLAWIKTLRAAIERQTAWIHVTKKGTHVTYTTASDLYQRFLNKGGLLLDAGCTNDDEIRAAGGCVFDLQCQRPKLTIIQRGPRGHGRGEGMGTARGRAHIEAEAKSLRAVLADAPGACVTTHLPVATMLDNPDVEHWGIHKGHNRWQKKRHGIIWGFNIPSPTVQLIGFKTYRQRMLALGVEIEDWNGETSREWVWTDTHKLIPSARMPAVKAARDWLIRYINSDLMQAVGRYRDLFADEPVLINVYGLMPIQGFGLHADEIRLEREGRLHNKTRARAVIAQGVVDLGEARTRAKLVEYFKADTGIRISNGDCDAMVAEIKVQARIWGVTLDAAARAACAFNTQFLNDGYEPLTIAKIARSVSIIPGAVAVAEMLDQCRRAPGAQRAGP